MNVPIDELSLEQLHRSGGKYKVCTGEDLAAMIKSLHGLWRFRLDTKRKGPRYLDLRFDAEDVVVSGDVFFDAARKEWEQSFRMTTAYCRDTGSARFLVLSCDSELDARRPRSSDIARLILRFTCDEDEIEAVEARAIRCNDAWRTDWSGECDPTRSNGEWPFTFSPGVFRQIKINYYFDDEITGEDQDRAERAMQELVPRYLAPEGLVLRANRKALPEDGTQFANISGPIANTQTTEDPWTFSLLFSGVHDELQREERGGHTNVPFGRAIGLDGAARRYRNRFGAVVFAGELQRDYENAKENNSAITPDNRDMRMVFTIMHELGHMLNLPHPWERDLSSSGHSLSTPAARTWMAYGSYYPFGAIAAQAYQGSDTPADRRERRRKHQQFLRVFEQDPRYSPPEREHLRHAAFDQIAVGMRAFSDTLKSPVVLAAKTETGDDQLTLRIDATKRAPLLFSNFAPPGYQHEPPSGRIELSTGNQRGIQFDFQSGALQIIVRDRPSGNDRRGLHPSAAAIRGYNPVVFLDNGLDWGADYADFFGPKADGQPYVRAFPLIPPIFWAGFDGFLAFTLQAVYYTPKGAAIYSNRKDLVYRPADRDEFERHVEPLIDRVREAGLADWRDRWLAYGVGLPRWHESMLGMPEGEVNESIRRWSFKLSGAATEPSDRSGKASAIRHDKILEGIMK